jgi:hypothetical protein
VLKDDRLYVEREDELDSVSDLRRHIRVTDGDTTLHEYVALATWVRELALE